MIDPITLSLISAGGKFALDYFGNKRQRKALEEQKKLTPEEASYKKKLTELSIKGDPNINQIRNRRISAVRQVGADTQQKITGDLIRSGMENSVVASELRRKAGGDVMRQVAEESQKIAERNRRFKQQYSDKLDKYNMDRSQYLKQLSAKQDAIPDPTTLGGFVETALPHALDFGAGQLTKMGAEATQQFELTKSLIGSGKLDTKTLESIMEGLDSDDPTFWDKLKKLLQGQNKGQDVQWQGNMLG